MKANLLFIAALFICTTTFARVWRVNNVPGASSNFTSIQAAHDGASAGDTLYMEGSASTYGNLICTKKLTILGPGYFLNNPAAPQFMKLTAQVDSVGFRTTAQGSSITGMQINGYVDVCSNITVQRCEFTPVGNVGLGNAGLVMIQDSAYNILISQNAFAQTYNGYAYRFIDYGNNAGAIGNITITNNIFEYCTNASAMIDLSTASASGVTITNNIFYYAYGSNFSLRLYAPTATVANNIFLNGGGSLTISAVSIINNISTSGGLPVGNGNVSNVTSSTLFTSGSNCCGTPQTLYTDTSFILAPGSAAHAAGVGGIDCGIFGGAQPYSISGIPAMPSIYNIIMPSYATQQNGLSVTVKAKANH